MRNDFPDHPAGPLLEDPDPSVVLDIRESTMGPWITRICGILMGLCGVMLMASSLGVGNQVMAGTSVVKTGGPMIVMGLLLALLGQHQEQNRKHFLRLRPDGVEFPSEDCPPLRWSDLAHIDMGVVSPIGGGIPKDYLLLKIRPDRAPQGESPFLTTVGRLAMAAAGWDVHVCMPGAPMATSVPHLVMQMRARAEAAAAAGDALPLPTGMQPLPAFSPGAAHVQASIRSQGEARNRKWMVGLGLGGGLLTLAGFGLYQAQEMMRQQGDDPSQYIDAPPEVVLGLGVLMLLGAGWIWASEGDDDE